MAEALVSKGLATCVRYSADNDQRSSKYDDLLAAEDKAQKSNKGRITIYVNFASLVLYHKLYLITYSKKNLPFQACMEKKTKLAAELQTLVVTWPKVNSFCLSFRELEECRLSWSLLLLLLVTGIFKYMPRRKTF